MALTKVDYVDGVTTIMAKNLNDIQDEVIANGTAIATQATQISGKADATALTAETAAREAAVSAEATARAAAINAEATARAYSDAALSGEVDDLKSALNAEQDGKVFISINWARGTLTSGGNYSASVTNRVATVNKAIAPVDFRISIANGFRYYLYTFEDSEITFKSYWKTTDLKITKGTTFKVVIARVTEDSSESADVDHFVSQLTFWNRTTDRLNTLADISQNAFGISESLAISASDAIKNANYCIKNDGTIAETVSAIGVSDKLLCVPGQNISFKLSSGSTFLVMAVFNSYGVLTHSVVASGYSSIVEHTYTFADGDAYFYLSGVPSRINLYSVQYGELPHAVDDINNRVTVLENAQSETILPAYWDTALQSKYPELWANDALIGSGGDSFVFITDVHYARNTLKSPALIKNLIKHTAVDKVFNGGDTLDEGDTVPVAIEKLSKWQGLMAGVRNFNIVGNHDNNNYNNENPANALTKGQFYGIMVKPEEQFIDTNGELYYCVDNESQKIRYICLAIDGFNSITAEDAQCVWLKSKLTEKDSSWTILIFQHRIWNSTTDAISDKAQVVIDAINSVWSNINAKFIGIIAGHTHLDYYITESVNGYLLIACNCDTLSGNNSGYTRTAGTTTEQSFSVFYVDKVNTKLYEKRIGAGSDRTWTYVT